MAGKYEINSFPTLMVFRDGDLVDQVEGFHGPRPFKAWLEKAANLTVTALKPWIPVRKLHGASVSANRAEKSGKRPLHSGSSGRKSSGSGTRTTVIRQFLKLWWLTGISTQLALLKPKGLWPCCRRMNTVSPTQMPHWMKALNSPANTAGRFVMKQSKYLLPSFSSVRSTGRN